MYVDSSGGRPINLDPISVKTCVLYDPQDGRIAHFHRVTSLPGSKERSTSEIEELALASARGSHDVGNLRALHASDLEFDYRVGTQYRVNLERMLLEKVPNASREDLRGRRRAGDGPSNNFLLWTLVIVALALAVVAMLLTVFRNSG